jgi:hypothetical protein
VNWDAISAAAEVIGAGAVVITLVYLAIQTRDNVRIERARAVWDAQISFVEVNDMLADGGKISELVFESLSNPDGLSQKDRYLVHRFARAWFQRMEAQHALYMAGILEPELWQLRLGYAKAILENGLGYAKAILENAVFEEFWELDKRNSMFTKRFIAAIDSANVTDFSGFLGISNSTEE